MRAGSLWLASCLLCACSGPVEAPQRPQARVTVKTPPAVASGPVDRKTQNYLYRLEIRFEPEVPKMGELFDVVAVFRDRDGSPIEDGKVSFDARMPQHAHGMMTDPIDDPGTCDDAGECTHPAGAYRTSGFKFHMAGDWTVTIDVVGPRGADSTSYVYAMK